MINEGSKIDTIVNSLGNVDDAPATTYGVRATRALSSILLNTVKT